MMNEYSFGGRARVRVPFYIVGKGIPQRTSMPLYVEANGQEQYPIAENPDYGKLDYDVKVTDFSIIVRADSEEEAREQVPKIVWKKVTEAYNEDALYPKNPLDTVRFQEQFCEIIEWTEYVPTMYEDKYGHTHAVAYEGVR